MEAQQVALVTGASSGFGRAVAERLAGQGYRVFGTSRSSRGEGPQGVEMLTLDVTQDQAVQDGVAQVQALAQRVDVLVNNAGQTHISLVEETSEAQARSVLETNFWGVVRVTNAVLPLMREQRSGRIINVSSLAGLVGAVGQGFYSASKFALEGYSEVLSAEVAPFNIHVSLVEPGFFRTNLAHTPAGGGARLDDYTIIRQGVEAALKRSFAQGGDPQEVADLIARIAASAAPRLRYRVGQDARWTPLLKMLLPEPLFRLGVRRTFNLPS